MSPLLRDNAWILKQAPTGAPGNSRDSETSDVAWSGVNLLLSYSHFLRGTTTGTSIDDCPFL